MRKTFSFFLDLPPPEPSSPPRPLTLCPITGKVLAQAEGEPTPEPSPEPSTDHNSGINSNTASEALMNVQMSPGGTTGSHFLQFIIHKKILV